MYNYLRTCKFKLNLDNIPPVIVKILTAHKKAGRLSTTEYNEFMTKYMLHTNGNHTCIKNKRTGKRYTYCPKYFSDEIIEVLKIYDEWRSGAGSVIGIVRLLIFVQNQ